jgi:hypothetical protein
LGCVEGGLQKGIGCHRSYNFGSRGRWRQDISHS